jgi:hypothetical protein
MKELTLYREDNGQYSTSEAQQDDVSGVYVQKEHLTDLKKENDEITAKLVNLAESKSCATCNNTGSHDYDDGFGGACSSPCHCTNNPYSTYSMINSTQHQSLADIRTEAVMSMFNHCKQELNHDHGQYTDCVVFEGDAVEYANKIKGAE